MTKTVTDLVASVDSVEQLIDKLRDGIIKLRDSFRNSSVEVEHVLELPAGDGPWRLRITIEKENV